VLLLPVSIVSGTVIWGFSTGPVPDPAAVFHDLSFTLLSCAFFMHVYFFAVNPLPSAESRTSGNI